MYLGLDDWTMVIEGFPEPFANCCFINDDNLYVCVYHSYTMTHNHFLWNTKTHDMIGTFHSVKLEASTKKNFPFKSFYNEDKCQIYTFYR